MTGDRGETEGPEFDPGVTEWMKNHTIADLKELACVLEESGEDATEVWEFIDDLSSMIHQMNPVDLEVVDFHFDEAVLVSP